MFTPDEMSLRAKALDLKSAADGASAAPYRELAMEWRMLAVQSAFMEALRSASESQGPETSAQV